MTNLSKLKVAIALVAGVSASAAIAAPKAVDVSQGREGVGKNVIFLNGDKINIKAEAAASQNAKVRLLASCVQSALKCANVVTPPGGGDTGGGGGQVGGGGDNTGGGGQVGGGGDNTGGGGQVGGGGDNTGGGGQVGGGGDNTGGGGQIGGGDDTGGGIVTGPTGPVVETPSLVAIVGRDANSNDVAAACVQDESFCKDANLKRVANRNSVIDEIFFYTEL